MGEMVTVSGIPVTTVLGRQPSDRSFPGRSRCGARQETRTGAFSRARPREAWPPPITTRRRPRAVTSNSRRKMMMLLTPRNARLAVRNDTRHEARA